MKNLNIDLKTKSKILILFLALFFLSATLKKDLEIYSGNKTIKLNVEIAKTEDERQMGLMYRDSLCKTCGMIFEFDEESIKYFWMKNTKIPLDMIFINKNKQIVGFVKNTTPYSEKSCYVERKSTYVLEVNSGFVDENKIKIGDYINY